LLPASPQQLQFFLSCYSTASRTNRFCRSQEMRAGSGATRDAALKRRKPSRPTRSQLRLPRLGVFTQPPAA
jgi:hypothetical protein